MLESFLIILEQVFLYFPLVLGAYLSFSMMKVPNLSIESAYVTGAIVASKMLATLSFNNAFVMLPLVCLASIVGGLLVGGVVSTLVIYGKIPHLLASILTIGLFHGINLFLLGGSNISLTSYTNPLSAGFLQTHPEFTLLGMLFLIIAIAGFLFFKTQLGYSLAVYGNNPHFFAHYGISTSYVMGCGLMLSTALAGLAGYLVAQTSGFVDINAGMGISLFCITALILGKTAMVLKKRVFSLAVPLVGIVAYCSIQQLLLKVGFNLKYFTMIQSIIVVMLLVFAYKKRALHELTSDHLGV